MNVLPMTSGAGMGATARHVALFDRPRSGRARDTDSMDKRAARLLCLLGLLLLMPPAAAQAVEPDGAFIRVTTNGYDLPDRRRRAPADHELHAVQRLRRPQGRRQPHRLPPVPEGRRDRPQPRPTAAPTASPAARRCGSPAAATRRRARAGSTSTSLGHGHRAHARDAARRHRHPQRQRRRLLPLRGRRAAVRALRHGRGLHRADR